MPKICRVEVARKQYATFLAKLPDDTDIQKIRNQPNYQPILDIANQLSLKWKENAWDDPEIIDIEETELKDDESLMHGVKATINSESDRLLVGNVIIAADGDIYILNANAVKDIDKPSMKTYIIFLDDTQKTRMKFYKFIVSQNLMTVGECEFWEAAYKDIEKDREDVRNTDNQEATKIEESNAILRKRGLENIKRLLRKHG